MLWELSNNHRHFTKSGNFEKKIRAEPTIPNKETVRQNIQPFFPGWSGPTNTTRSQTSGPNLDVLSTYHPHPRCQRHRSERRWSYPQLPPRSGFVVGIDIFHAGIAILLTEGIRKNTSHIPIFIEKKQNSYDPWYPIQFPQSHLFGVFLLTPTMKRTTIRRFPTWEKHKHRRIEAPPALSRFWSTTKGWSSWSQNSVPRDMYYVTISGRVCPANVAKTLTTWAQRERFKGNVWNLDNIMKQSMQQWDGNHPRFLAIPDVL